MPRQRLVPKQVNSIKINKPLKWIPDNSYTRKKKKIKKVLSKRRIANQDKEGEAADK